MKNKSVAITGSTGGIGKEICLELAKQGYDLVLINRNEKKSQELASFINSLYKNIKINIIKCDLESLKSVKEALIKLEKLSFDILILNAGIYNVPIKKLDSGYNNVFQVNFISQYYLARKLLEKGMIAKVVAVSSLVASYTRTDPDNIDFTGNKKSSLIYSNSKRFLMFSLMSLFKGREEKLAVCHPGVTCTNMTSHYPKWINWFVKMGIKVFFPSNRKAAMNIVIGVNKDTEYLEWIGPRVLNVWGRPVLKRVKFISNDEIEAINGVSEKIYSEIDRL